MNTYNNIHFNGISEILMQAALGVSVVCGYKYVSSDMVHSLSDLHHELLNGLTEPYYIAIREMGTECGYKEHCIDRCKGLGYPLIIAKIEKADFDFNMKITFTHDWNSGYYNDHIEQEFNSL